MSEKNLNLNVLSCLIMTIGLASCGGDKQQVTPSGEDTVPDALTFNENNFDVKQDGTIKRQLYDAAGVDANIEAALPAALQKEREKLEADPTIANDAIDGLLQNFELNFRSSFRAAQLYDGKAKLFIVTPENPTVTGLSDYATHTFTLSSDDRVAIHGKNDCQYSAEENSVKDKIAHLRVNGAPDLRSVTKNDNVDFAFNIPDGRYGVTYNATINYAGETQIFSITTPEAVIKPKMLEFFDANQVRIQPLFTSKIDPAVRGSSDLFNYDTGNNAISLQKVLPTDIDLPYRDLLNDDGSLIPVKDGNVYTFLAKKPIAGSSPFVRFSLNFDYDKTKKFENRPYTVRNGQVEYGDPVIEDAIKIRAIGTGKELRTYSGSCAAQDDILAVSFHIPENTFGEEYTAKLTWNYFDDEGAQAEQPQVIEFKLITETKDNNPDPISQTVFTNNSSNAEPGKPINYQIDLTGYNAEVAISSSNTEYSFDGINYMSGSGMIPENSRLFIRVMPSASGGQTTNHSIVIGEETYSWSVNTKANDAKVLNAGLDYPPQVSATAADSVTLRGHAYYMQNGQMSTEGITAANLLIGNQPVDSYDAATGVWLKSVPTLLSEGNLTNDHSLDFSIDGISAAMALKNTQANIRRLPDTTTQFPSDIEPVSQMTDLTYDARSNALYISTYTPNHLIRLSMASDLESLKIENKNSPDLVYSPSLGIQVNNNDALNRRYVYKAGNDLKATLLQPGFWLDKVSANSFLNGPETVPFSTQLVFDDFGKILYVTGNNEIAQVTPSNNVFDNTDNFIQVPFRDSADFPDTHKKTISNQFSSHSVDMFTIADVQYIVSLSRSTVFTATSNTNTGINSIWVIKKAARYDITSSATMLNLVHAANTPLAGQPYVLNNASSIAIDDRRQKAYVINGGNVLAEVDLSQIHLGDTTASVVERAFVSPQNEIGQLSSVIMEGGLPYLVATDRVKNSVFALDQYTGESVYLLQSNKPLEAE